jgi:hypothetical protein
MLAGSNSRIGAWWEGVAEMRGRLAGCAHPLEKSGTNFKDISMQLLCVSLQMMQWDER